MNIFEGSRRIAKLVGGLWIFGTLIGAVTGGFNDHQGNSFDVAEFCLYLTIPPLFILGFTVAMGWIVRGFRGIPMGKDSKSD